MTNKKLWLSLLVVVLVVCMLSVSLVSCKKDDSTPTPTGPSIESQAIDAIINGIKASLEDGDMTDFKVDGTIGLTLGDKEYELKLALELDLLQFDGYYYKPAEAPLDDKTEYFKGSNFTVSTDTEAPAGSGTLKNPTKVETPKAADIAKYYIRVAHKGVEHANSSNTKINAELRDVKANETILGIYYWDREAGSDPYQGNVIYVQAKTKTETKKVYFPAPYIAKVQDLKGGQVDFHGVDLTDESIWGTLDTVTGILGKLATNGKLTDDEASITLKIGDLLDPENESNLLTLVSGLQDWLDALNLDIDAEALGEVLPNISLVLSANLDEGVATGFDISLNIDKKDDGIVITNNNKAHTLLDIQMSKDIEVGISLEYTIGTCTPWKTDFTGFVPQENILDARLSVDLYLGEAIEMDIANMLHLKVPAGYYTLSAEIAANPWPIIKYINDGIDFSTTPKMIDSIKLILQAVNALELDLINTKDKDGAAIAADKQVVLHVLVGNKYQYSSTTQKYTLLTNSDGSAKKSVSLSTSILSSTSASLSLAEADIDAAINLVISVMGKSNKADSGDLTDPTLAPTSAAEDDTTKLLRTIGGYLLGAYIGINDGTHAGLYASFKSADTTVGYIPFSGYTKWQGAYNSAYDYYTVKDGTGTMVKATAFETGKKYSTLTPKHFEEVNTATTTFDKFRQYYEWDGAKYKESTDTSFGAKKYYIFVEDQWTECGDITKFEDGTDYYYWKDAEYVAAAVTASSFEGSHPDYYVKAGTGAKDFKGIGLDANLAVGDNIVINATVTNMDIFGLPTSLSARISNLQISFFNNDYPIFSNNDADTYQDVAGKIA